MKRLRVLIVEDSAVVRALLEHIIGRDPRLEVCATAGSAEEAMQILDTLTPDVIAMDVQLPGIDGLEATRRIMSRKPLPIVVVAASREGKDGNSLAMEALRAGALTVLEKPPGTSSGDYESLADRLCTQLVIMTQVKLVRRRSIREPNTIRVRSQLVSPACGVAYKGAYKMLGIVCSTGGPGALVNLLSALGPSFPLPILLVQHMTATFLTGFASWLESLCPFSVAIVKDGCLPAVKTVHIAPAEQHLSVRNGLLRLDCGAPVCFQRPSGDVLFQSMARDLGTDAIGLLLTGMGEDGATGLRDIREAGGFTIAEDESTAVVYGMPGAAVHLGAVCESLPLPLIAPRILDLVREAQRMAS